MRITSVLFLFLFFAFTLTAQNIAGDYFIPTAKGEISLELKAAGANQYTGFMVDESGGRFPLQARESSAGVLQGTISGQAGQMTFQAYSDGSGLQFSLIPLTAAGQPNYNNPIEFAMQRRGGASSPAPSMVNVPAGGARPGMSPPPASSMTPRTPALGGNQPVPSPAAPNYYPPAQTYTPAPANPAGSMGGPLGSGGNNWSGTFNGNVNGTASIMTIQQQGGILSGDINAGGYRYTLQGNVTGTQFTGRLSDPQTGALLNTTGILEGDRITFNVLVGDAFSGQTQPLQVLFTRSAAGPLQANPGMGQSRTFGSAGAVERDARLVGSWLYSDSYTSGQYGFATQYRLIIQPDGTYLYGDGRVAGGGPGTGVDSGNGGYTRGEWKTQNSTIYINEGMGWQPYAGYYLEGGSMLFKFADGTQQLWKRTN